MKLNPTNRTKMYDLFVKVYNAATGGKFAWKQGEKGRVKVLFTLVAEAMSKRDEEEFGSVLKVFGEYLIFQAEKWLSWAKRDRMNYIGFLTNKDNIQIFVKGLNKPNGKLNIVGTKEKDVWEF